MIEETGKPNPPLPVSSLDNDEATQSSQKYRGMTIDVLPPEILEKCFSDLDPKDIANCSAVSQKWNTTISNSHLLERSCYRICHQVNVSPSLYTAEQYNSSIRDWLNSLSNEGKKEVAKLDQLVGHKHFSKILFSSIAKALTNTILLKCSFMTSIEHYEMMSVNYANFSPDGKNLVALDNGTHVAVIYEPVDGQWKKKASINHSEYMTEATFSSDGKYLATASGDHTAKIYELVNEEWQEKKSIKHSVPVIRASFSPDGKYLATAAAGTATILELVDGQWQDKLVIEHSEYVCRVNFSPDGKYLVISSEDGTSKIHERVNGQWQEKSTINHSAPVIRASLSPDGKHLVIATNSHEVQIWRLVDGYGEKKRYCEYAHCAKPGTFSPDGKHFVVFCRREVQIFGLNNGIWGEKDYFEAPSKVKSANFSPDGRHIITSSAKAINIYTLAKMKTF